MTKLFLRNTTTNGISNYYDMVTTAGSSAATNVVNTAASGTEIQFTQTAGGAAAAWISGRVPAGGFTLTTTDISAWLHESNMNANCGGRYRVFRRSAAGVETEIGGGPFNDGVEFGTAATEMLWTGNVTDQAFSEDDRILLKLYITNIGTMASGFTCTLTFNAADAATGDSFFNIAETVTFKGETVTGTLAKTAANDTLSASGWAGTITGTLAKTAANDTLSSAGTTTVTGSLAKTNANDTLSASGSVGSVTGTLAVTTANDTVSAAGTTTVTGTLAKTATNDTLSAAGNTTVTGTLAVTTAGDTLSASGTATAAETAQQTSSGGRYRHYSISDDLEPEQKKPPKAKTKPQNLDVDQLVSKPSRWEKPSELINQAIIQYNQQVMEGDQAEFIARGLMDEEEAICLLLLVA